MVNKVLIVRSGNHLLGLFEIDRDQLRHALLDHGHAEEPVHPCHRHRMVGNDQEPRRGLARHLVQQVTEAHDIGIIKRRVHLVEYADRGGVGQKNRKDQRHGGQRLLAPPTRATG